MNEVIRNYHTFIRLTERAEALVAAVEDSRDWEIVYDTIFSPAFSGKIHTMGLGPSYCDPDSSYEKNVRAYVAALREQADRYQRLLKVG